MLSFLCSFVAFCKSDRRRLKIMQSLSKKQYSTSVFNLAQPLIYNFIAYILTWEVRELPLMICQYIILSCIMHSKFQIPLALFHAYRLRCSWDVTWNRSTRRDDQHDQIPPPPISPSKGISADMIHDGDDDVIIGGWRVQERKAQWFYFSTHTYFKSFITLFVLKTCE